MNRHEAAKIFGEVMRRCNGSALTKRVNLANKKLAKSRSDSENYELQICVGPNDFCLKERIGAVLEKHKLSLKQSENTITIYQPNKETQEL